MNKLRRPAMQKARGSSCLWLKRGRGEVAGGHIRKCFFLFLIPFASYSLPRVHEDFFVL